MRSLVDTVREMNTNNLKKMVEAMKPFTYEPEMTLEATDENLAFIQRVRADAAKHHKRCEIMLKVIDNT